MVHGIKHDPSHAIRHPSFDGLACGVPFGGRADLLHGEQTRLVNPDVVMMVRPEEPAPPSRASGMIRSKASIRGVVDVHLDRNSE